MDLSCTAMKGRRGIREGFYKKKKREVSMYLSIYIYIYMHHLRYHMKCSSCTDLLGVYFYDGC